MTTGEVLQGVLQCLQAFASLGHYDGNKVQQPQNHSIPASGALVTSNTHTTIDT